MATGETFTGKAVSFTRSIHRMGPSYRSLVRATAQITWWDWDRRMASHW